MTTFFDGSAVPDLDFDLDDEPDVLAEQGTFSWNAGTSNRSVFFVASYDVTREYGGPEEGGWYYDAGTICSNVSVFTDRAGAMAYADELRRGHALADDRPSCLNGYRSTSVRVTSHLPVDHFPATTPRYS